MRSGGAFFMRRTFKGDDLYKAIFKEYVTLLASDCLNMEFFIEGTRSRTNKILAPKYGFISILTGAFYKLYVYNQKNEVWQTRIKVN